MLPAHARALAICPMRVSDERARALLADFKRVVVELDPP